MTKGSEEAVMTREKAPTMRRRRKENKGRVLYDARQGPNNKVINKEDD